MAFSSRELFCQKWLRVHFQRLNCACELVREVMNTESITIYANELTVTHADSNIFIHSDEHIQRRVSLKKVMAKYQE